MTFLAALRHDRVTAPWLIDGPVNGESFRVYVESVLAPTLRPGDIVIMDNLGSHKGHAVRHATVYDAAYLELARRANTATRYARPGIANCRDCHRCDSARELNPSPRQPQFRRRGRLMGETGNRSRSHCADTLDFDAAHRIESDQGQTARALLSKDNSAANRHRGRPCGSPPCHTTRHAGPHRAVREIEVMRDGAVPTGPTISGSTRR